jgi:tetratricopeptide (TPR) repeat protein
MLLDPYAACPCGSGKKFKWCCQPIHAEIAQAFEQQAQGQNDAALRLMNDVLAKHPDNPEAWCQKAQLLMEQGQVDAAEEALQKALELNPNYPLAFFLRGRFRHAEGEFPGALLLYRKAAELYDPTASPILAELYSAIADCEMKLNRPVAARAALEQAIRAEPSDPELRQGLAEVFDKAGRFPEAARRAYTYLGTPAAAPADRRQAWQRALGRATTGKLADAARGFEQLTGEDQSDAAAWYNLGLTRAWLGENARAVEALDRYVPLEPDEQRAGAAWALGEVLRCGHGMQDQSDYQESSYFFQIRDPQQLARQLEQWHRERRLVGVQQREEEGILTGLVLQRVQGLTAEHAAAQAPHLGAYLMLMGNVLRLWNGSRAALDEVLQELRERAGPYLTEPHFRTVAPAFHDVAVEAMVFPINTPDPAAQQAKVREALERYFEETWIHRPRVSLQGVPPIDAAGHAVLRKKLRGVIEFLQQCLGLSAYPYDFERLRRKLGLVEAAPAPAAAAPDLGALGAAELAALDVERLSDEQLEQAYQVAQKLDARDLAGRFARALVGRPPRAERPDRYTWFNHLINLALSEGNTEAALEHLGAAAKADAEHNEGRRQNDYDLRRAQVHAKRGEMDAAQEVFDRLIERVPAELRYRSSAAEAMLSARQGARALRFAEGGLAKARQQNSRDSEEHFLELVSAAKKQTGQG